MSDQLKKRSAKQQAASRANGAQGHGPVTAEGKKHSSANAVKHGLFTTELFVPEQEREYFKQLRQALAADLEPDSVLLWILFDDLVSLAWRWKMALRLEQGEMGRQLTVATEAQPNAAGGAIPKRYNSQQRIAFLDTFETLIRKHGRIDESLQAEGERILGAELMSALFFCKPEPGAQLDYRLDEMIMYKVGKYHIPSPLADVPDKELRQLKATGQRVVEEALSPIKQELSLKLIEHERQRIQELEHSIPGGTEFQSSRHELAMRTQESLRRNFVRMYHEYKTMKHEG